MLFAGARNVLEYWEEAHAFVHTWCTQSLVLDVQKTWKDVKAL